MAHLEWKDDAGAVRWARFDAVRVVDHTQNAAVTRHPVEKGADIADHVRVELPSVTITGYVSKLPLHITAKIGGRKDMLETIGEYQMVELPPSPASPTAAGFLRGGIVDGVKDLLSGLAGPTRVESIVITDEPSRVREMSEALTEAQEKRRMIRLVDEARDYDDMVITHIGVTRSQREYGAVFQVTLEQIKVVSTKLVDAPVPAEVRGQLAKAAGAAAAKALGGGQTEEEKKKSAALKMAQGLLGGLGFGDALKP